APPDHGRYLFVDPLRKRTEMHSRIKLFPNGRARKLSVRKRLSTTLRAMDRDPAHPHAGTRRALERATEAGAPEGAGPVPGGQERSTRRLLIIGTDDAARILADELRVHFPADYEVVGFVGDGPGAITGNGSKILGSRAEIDELVRRHQIDEVMIADFARGRRGGVRAVSRVGGLS